MVTGENISLAQDYAKNGAKKSNKSFICITARKIMVMIVLIGVIVGCSSCGTTQPPNPVPEPENQEMNKGEEMAEAYKQAVKQIDSYDFQMGDFTVTDQQYALVDMNEDGIPELLLQCSSNDGLDYIKVLAYDADKNAIIDTADVLNTGVAGAGGFRGSISSSNKGNGLLLTQGSSGTGDFVTYRVMIKGETLTQDVVDEFNLENEDETKSGDEIYAEEADITWYEITDDSELLRLEKHKWE